MISENMRVSADSLTERAFGLGQALGRSRSFPRTLTWTSAAVAQGEILYREGAFADRVHAVSKGIVKLVAHMPNGRVRILGLHGPGAILGLMTPASDSTTYNHTAIAVTDVESQWAPAAQLRRIRRECAEEYLQLLERHCE